MTERCILCELAQGKLPASVVYEDDLVIAIIDTRQFHPGHTLVMPKQHLKDVRELDPDTGAALMAAVTLLTRAVGEAFPHEGISLWHSIGPAAFQEVPHCHIHIHPRRTDDGFLRVYPSAPTKPGRETMDRYAEKIRSKLKL